MPSDRRRIPAAGMQNVRGPGTSGSRGSSAATSRRAPLPTSWRCGRPTRSTPPLSIASLRLAADLGFNVIRVYLHDLLWQPDPAGFMVGSTASSISPPRHGIHCIVVFFDGVWHNRSYVGPRARPDPRRPQLALAAEPKLAGGRGPGNMAATPRVRPGRPLGGSATTGASSCGTCTTSPATRACWVTRLPLLQETFAGPERSTRHSH